MKTRFHSLLFKFNSYRYSTGRYADGVAGMECGGGRELSIMSSHLESFISKEQTSSGERVRQMKDSLKVGLSLSMGCHSRVADCLHEPY